MRSRAVPSVVVALSLAACSRDLAVPPRPSIEALGVVPAFQSVAPREPLQFAGAGGVGPYTFSFARGGQLSGADATLGASGAYVAGSNGSAQDIIEVTDSRGATAAATVSVGQRIAITPAFSGTVPGGRIAFQATGGSGTYQFTPGTSGSGGTTAPDGVYLAGPAGNTVDAVIATDAFGAFAQAEVQVGPQLQVYRSETRAVAPHESVTFIALGGQPPYTFSLAAKGSGADAHIDANSGVYVAGSRAADLDPYSVTTDVIQVTDHANQAQTATLAVPVGPRLRLVISASQAHPGETVVLSATGGKAPYTFGFAARTSPAVEPNRDRGGNGGNRSGGTVSALSGEYVPGPSPGAIDFLQVTDATGAPPDVQPGPPVAGITIPIERGTFQCLAADVNGDQSQDAVLLARNEVGARVVVATGLAGAAPSVHTQYLPWRSVWAPFVHALEQRGRDSVLVFGGDLACPSGSCGYSDPDVWELIPDLAGNLGYKQLAGGGQPWGTITVPNDPVYGGPTYTHQETQGFALNAGTLVLNPAGTGTAYLYSDGWDGDTIQSASPFSYPACPSTTANDRTVLRWRWIPGASGPTQRPECLLVTGGGCPTCNGQQVVAFEAGDFDGDGRLDIAYVQASGGVDYADGTLGAKVYVALGTGGTPEAPAAFVATGHQAWPADTASGSWRLDYRDHHTGTAFLTIPASRPLSGGAKDTLLVQLVDPGGNQRLFATHDPGAGFFGPFDPSGVGRGSAGVARYAASGTTAAVSWDGAGGEVRGFEVTGISSTVPQLVQRPPAATMAYGVSAACFPDVNGDGIPDLVAAGETAQVAQLVLGDGTNSAFPATGPTYGVRAHLHGSDFPVALGDLDGDGFADLAAAATGSGLDVLWGGGGMLARGPRISTAAVNAVAIADFGHRSAGGAVIPSVFYQDQTGAFGLVHGDGRGNFDPAVAVAGVTADGGAVAPGFLIANVGDMGASAPGLDLVTMETSATGSFTHAWLYQGTRIVDVTSPRIPQPDPDHLTPDMCWTLPVGTAPGNVASLCVFDDVNASNHDRNLVRLFVSHVQNPDGGPEGPKPAFTPWLALPPGSGLPSSPWFSSTPGVRGSVAQIGTLPDGTALFMFNLDAIYVVEVKLVGADPTSAGSWSVATYPLAVPSGDVMIGNWGHLDSDPATLFHVVATTKQGMRVIRRTAAGYAPTQVLSVLQVPIGVGRLAAGSPGDVVGIMGNFAGSFSGTTEIVPILNLQDGTGRLR